MVSIISNAFGHIEGLTQRKAASSSEAAETSKELVLHAEQLSGMVAEFQLPSEEAVIPDAV